MFRYSLQREDLSLPKGDSTFYSKFITKENHKSVDNGVRRVYWEKKRLKFCIRKYLDN